MTDENENPALRLPVMSPHSRDVPPLAFKRSSKVPRTPPQDLTDGLSFGRILEKKGHGRAFQEEGRSANGEYEREELRTPEQPATELDAFTRRSKIPRTPPAGELATVDIVRGKAAPQAPTNGTSTSSTGAVIRLGPRAPPPSQSMPVHLEPQKCPERRPQMIINGVVMPTVPARTRLTLKPSASTSQCIVESISLKPRAPHTPQGHSIPGQLRPADVFSGCSRHKRRSSDEIQGDMRCIADTKRRKESLDTWQLQLDALKKDVDEKTAYAASMTQVAATAESTAAMLQKKLNDYSHSWHGLIQDLKVQAWEAKRETEDERCAKAGAVAAAAVATRAQLEAELARSDLRVRLDELGFAQQTLLIDAVRNKARTRLLKMMQQWQRKRTLSAATLLGCAAAAVSRDSWNNEVRVVALEGQLHDKEEALKGAQERVKRVEMELARKASACSDLQKRAAQLKQEKDDLIREKGELRVEAGRQRAKQACASAAEASAVAGIFMLRKRMGGSPSVQEVRDTETEHSGREQSQKRTEGARKQGGCDFSPSAVLNGLSSRSSERSMLEARKGVVKGIAEFSPEPRALQLQRPGMEPMLDMLVESTNSSSTGIDLSSTHFRANPSHTGNLAPRRKNSVRREELPLDSSSLLPTKSSHVSNTEGGHISTSSRTTASLVVGELAIPVGPDLDSASQQLQGDLALQTSEGGVRTQGKSDERAGQAVVNKKTSCPLPERLHHSSTPTATSQAKLRGGSRRLTALSHTLSMSTPVGPAEVKAITSTSVNSVRSQRTLGSLADSSASSKLLGTKRGFLGSFIKPKSGFKIPKLAKR